MLSCPSGSIKVFYYNKIVLCRSSSETFKRLARRGSIEATMWLPKVTVYRRYRPLKIPGGSYKTIFWRHPSS